MISSAPAANDALDALDLQVSKNRNVGKVFARASCRERRTELSGAAIEAVIAADFIDGLKRRCSEVSRVEDELLDQLFLVGMGTNCVSVLPADAHPGSPLRIWQPRSCPAALTVSTSTPTPFHRSG